MNKFILIVFLTILSSTVSANVWQQPFTVKYVLGDGDSRSTARELALEQIKIKASNEAGNYIHTTNSLINDRLTENIQVIGASMVMLSDIQEQLSSKNNRIILVVTALARIDESELKKRVLSMQQDTTKAKQITQLRNENQILSNELDTIRLLLAKKQSNSIEVATILKRQSNLLSRLEDNAAAVKRVFMQGTLFQMAQTNTAQLEQVKAQLETEFFVALMQTDVVAEIVSVEQNDKNFTALVNLSWRVPKSLSLKTIWKHLNHHHLEGKRPYDIDSLSISSYLNTAGKGKTTLSESLFNYLGHQHIYIEVILGDKTFQAPLFWGRKGGIWGKCNKDDSASNRFKNNEGLLCLTLHQKSTEDLKGVNYHDDENPIKFRLTHQEVNSITTIETKIIRR